MLKSEIGTKRNEKEGRKETEEKYVATYLRVY
jgi:hypothetical protein